MGLALLSGFGDANTRTDIDPPGGAESTTAASPQGKEDGGGAPDAGKGGGGGEVEMTVAQRRQRAAEILKKEREEVQVGLGAGAGAALPCVLLDARETVGGGSFGWCFCLCRFSGRGGGVAAKLSWNGLGELFANRGRGQIVVVVERLDLFPRVTNRPRPCVTC